MLREEFAFLFEMIIFVEKKERGLGEILFEFNEGILRVELESGGEEFGMACRNPDLTEGLLLNFLFNFLPGRLHQN